MTQQSGATRSFDGLLVFAGVFALLLLRLDASWYENDGHFIVHRLIGGEPVQPRHWLLETLLRPFAAAGFDVASSARIASALGVAIACGFVHATACALGYTRVQALFAGFAFAATGFSILFGTVVEFHGLFAAFASGAIYLAVLTSKRESTRATLALATATGVVSATAAFAHATGQLLPALLCAIVVFAGGGLARAVLASIAIVVVHALVAWSVPLLVTTFDGFARDAQQSADYLAAHFGALTEKGITGLLRDAGVVAWREWILPYCAISVVWVFAFRRRESLRLALPLAFFFTGQLLLTRILLGGEGSSMHESGAYLVPSGLMAALVAAMALPRDARNAAWIGGVLLLVGAFVGLEHRGERGVTEERFVERAALFDAHLQPDALIWAQDLTSIGALLDTRARSGFFITHALAELDEAAIVAGLGPWLGKLEKDLAGGRQLALTGSAVDYLENRLSAGKLILAALEKRMESRVVPDADGVAGQLALRIYRLRQAK